MRPSGVVNDAPIRVPDTAVTTTGAIGETPVAAAAGTVLIVGPGSRAGEAAVVTAGALGDAADDPAPDGGGAAGDESGDETDGAEVDRAADGTAGTESDGDAVGASVAGPAGTVTVTEAVSVGLLHPAATSTAAVRTVANTVVRLRRAGGEWECAVMVLLKEWADRTPVEQRAVSVTRAVSGWHWESQGRPGGWGYAGWPPLRHLWGRAGTHMPWSSAFISVISAVWLVVMVSASARASGF